MTDSNLNARSRLLSTAEQLVNGDRNAQYGDPLQDFRRTATMWTAYLGVRIEPWDVAALMGLLKLSRIRWSPTKMDSWVDLAGYAACGWDCANPQEAGGPPLRGGFPAGRTRPRQTVVTRRRAASHDPAARSPQGTPPKGGPPASWGAKESDASADDAQVARVVPSVVARVVPRPPFYPADEIVQFDDVGLL